MGKNQSASNLTNIIKQDGSGNIVFTSGSTTLATISTTGQLSGSTAVKSATTASYADNFTVTGNLTAQTLVVQTITSSVDFVTGSTRFGSFLTNTHIFSGSVAMNPGGLFVSGSGQVGIGTVNPATKFDLAGTIGNFQIASSGAEVFLTRNDNNDILATGGTSSGITIGAQSYVRFSVGTSYTERMRITSGGNVGIGTTTPSQRLDIRDTFQDYTSGLFNQIIYSTTSQSTGYGASIGLGGVFTGTSVVSFGAIVGAKENATDNNTAGYLSLMTRGNAGPISERMRISSTGNIGAGTNSPQARLDVVDSSYNQYTLRVQSSAGNNANGWGGIGLSGEGANTKAAILFLSDGGSYSRGSILFCNNSDFNQNNATPANERMRITSTGLVGIANLAGSGTRTVTADSSGYLSAASDSSLKQEDTTHIVEGLAEILQLQPRAYKWLSDIERRGDEAATEIGFFANEVAPIIPSAAPKSNDGLYGFYDRAVIATLVKAIQELNTKLDAANAEIEALKNK